jgi:hypothetical protein
MRIVNKLFIFDFKTDNISLNNLKKIIHLHDLQKKIIHLKKQIKKIKKNIKKNKTHLHHSPFIP